MPEHTIVRRDRIGAAARTILDMGLFSTRSEPADLATWHAWATHRGIAIDGTFPDITLRGLLDGGAFGMTPIRVTESAALAQSDREYDVWVPLAIDTHDLWVEPHFLLDRFTHQGDPVRRLGDAAFDRAFVVVTDDEDLASRVLGTAQRAALLDARGQRRDIRLSASTVRTRLPQGSASPVELERALRVLVPLSRSFGA